MTYLKNAWYVAAWSTEINEGLLDRTILGEKVVMFRGKDGAAAVLQDRCPHRFAPLSRGQLKEGNVQCGYHGLVFSPKGELIESPFTERIPPNCHIKSYPVVERYFGVWVWMGDPALADPALIPDFEFLYETDKTYTVPGYTYVAAHYELENDNLLDLTHIEYVHGRSFGGKGVFMRGTNKIEINGARQLVSKWWMPDVPSSMVVRLSEDAPERVDRWIDTRWDAPSTLKIEVGFVPVGHARETAVQLGRHGHFLTPETETSTHYFYAHALPILPGEPRRDGSTVRHAFQNEDRPMLEAVQGNMTKDFWGENPAILALDVGPIRARRMLGALIEAEQRELAASATSTKV